MRTSLTATLLSAATLALALLVYSASPASAASSSPIPTGISSSCSSFFTSLNSDASIKNCTTPLLSATTYYTNASTGSSTSATEAALKESLSELCATDAGCDTDLVRQYLSQFWTSCMTEIQEENKEVQDVYDVLYLLVPFREAICSQDDDGNYCLLDTANSTSSTSKRSLAQPRLGIPKNLRFASTLMERIKDHGEVIARHQAKKQQERRVVEDFAPRATSDNASDAASAVDSLNGTNIAFLFLQPDSDKDVLCGTCSQSILAAYIKFETALPYAIGLSNSAILSGQSALYKAGQATCGDQWATTVNEIAGTTDFAKVAAAGIVKLSLTLLVLGVCSAGMALLM